MKIENIVKIAIVALLSVAMLCVPAAAINTIWNGTVDINPGTFTFTASNAPYNDYSYSRMTDLGAFDLASSNFDTYVTDAWYSYYGSFYVQSLGGVAADDTNYTAWFMYIDDVEAEYGLGNASNTMTAGQTLEWYYAPYTFVYEGGEWTTVIDKTNATDYIGIYTT